MHYPSGNNTRQTVSFADRVVRFWKKKSVIFVWLFIVVVWMGRYFREPLNTMVLQLTNGRVSFLAQSTKTRCVDNSVCDKDGHVCDETVWLCLADSNMKCEQDSDCNGFADGKASCNVVNGTKQCMWFADEISFCGDEDVTGLEECDDGNSNKQRWLFKHLYLWEYRLR